MPVTIKIAVTPDDLAACLHLRREVFIREQNVPEHEEVDEDDGRCTHVLASDGARHVGAARFQVIGDYMKLQRVCVSADMRGQHIGAGLVRFMIERAKDMPNLTAVRLGSQTHALAFYHKLGFQAEGDEFMDAGIPHLNMVLALAK